MNPSSESKISIVDRPALTALVGSEVGVSRWREVNQADVDAFAAVTGDDQWIHVDVARAAEGPFGGTIAHGLLLLSLGPAFLFELLDWSTASRSINYGYERVRNPAPLPTGARVRMRLGIKAVEPIEGGHKITFVETFEGSGVERPVCVAEFIALVYV